MKEMVVCVVCLTLIAAPIAAPPVAADARTKALLVGLASAAGTIVVGSTQISGVNTFRVVDTHYI